MLYCFFVIWFSRHDRFTKRKKEQDITNKCNKKQELQYMDSIESESNIIMNDGIIETVESDINHVNADKECQVDFLTEERDQTNTFICNRYIYEGLMDDAQTQTQIPLKRKLAFIPSQKVVKNKECATDTKVFSDKSTNVNWCTDERKEKPFLKVFILSKIVINSLI